LATTNHLAENHPAVPRAFLILGGIVDVLIALFLVLVFGWIMDSWHDPNGAWVGIAVTGSWLAAFALSAGSAFVGWRMHHRGAPSGRVALVLWLPALLLIGVCAIGFMVSPP